MITDREMLAYAMIAILGLVLAIALIRWWYLRPKAIRRPRGQPGNVYSRARFIPVTTPPSRGTETPDAD